MAISYNVKYALTYVQRPPFLGNFSIERKAYNHKNTCIGKVIAIIIKIVVNWMGTQMPQQMHDFKNDSHTRELHSEK